MLWACSALLCGSKGKQRDAVSAQQVKEWANPRHVLRRGLVVFWPAKIIWRKREGGRREARSGQVKCERMHRVGLVWFGLVLALVLVLTGPGSGKVQSRAVRCGLWLHAQAGNEPGWGLVPGRAAQVPEQKPPLALWGICLVRVAATVWSGSERGPSGDEIRYWIVTDGPGPFSSLMRYLKKEGRRGTLDGRSIPRQAGQVLGRWVVDLGSLPARGQGQGTGPTS